MEKVPALSVEASGSLHWVGVFDPMLRVFDIIMHTPYVIILEVD